MGDDRQQWLAERRKGIGGSDVAAILGFDPYRSAMDVYLEKLDRHPDPIDDDDPPEPVLWGNLLEPVVASEVHRRTGLAVYTEPTQVHPEHDWMRVNVDRVLYRPVDGVYDPSDPGVLECKTTSAWRAADWRGGIPAPALTQVCWAYAVTGWRWGKVAGLIGGQRLEIHDVGYDEDLVHLIVERVGSFWTEHVLTRTPPPAVPQDRQLLRKLHTGGAGTTDLTPPLQQAVADFNHWRKVGLDAKRAREAAEVKIREAVGDHDTVVDTDGQRVVWFTDIPEREVTAHTRPATRRLYVSKGEPE